MQQAQAEGLTLVVADSKTGYYGVYLVTKPGQRKPYQVQLRRGGKKVSLGNFATAEEAALCVARSPEEQAAAGRGTGKAPARRTRTAKLMHAPPIRIPPI